MARKTSTVVVDSFSQEVLTESEALEVVVALGESAWRLDLSAESLGKLREALEPFTRHEEARPTSSLRRAAAPQYPPAYLAAVRAWAWERGLEVAPKGLVAKSVREAFDAAQPEASASLRAGQEPAVAGEPKSSPAKSRKTPQPA